MPSSHDTLRATRQVVESAAGRRRHPISPAAEGVCSIKRMCMLPQADRIASQVRASTMVRAITAGFTTLVAPDGRDRGSSAGVGYVTAALIARPRWSDERV